MSNRVFVWVAHPGSGSFNAALASAYAHGARDGGAKVRVQALAEMEFDTQFRGYHDAPALEPDLLAWQDNIAWSDHLFTVHPLWWGAMPALAKTVLDRALTSGFAYKYKARGVKWDKLLAGRRGDAIITADTPAWIDRYIYRGPARKVLSAQFYDFCGVKPGTVRQIGSIKTSDEAKRASWLEDAYTLGLKAARAKPLAPELNAPETQPAMALS